MSDIQTVLVTDNLNEGRAKINSSISSLNTTKQEILLEGPFVDGDKTKLDSFDPLDFDLAGSANTAENNAKTYADGLVVGLIDDRGNYDASGNVFPSSGGSGTAGAILKGDLWLISVAGTLGGVSVAIGDRLRALTDTPGQTSTNWAISEANIGYVPENNDNKSTSITGNETSNTLFPTIKAVVDWAVGLFAPKGLITTSGLTQSTAKILGRSTAGTGAVEEITLGTGLSFDGTTLNAEVSETSTNTLTNKRITKRVVTTTQSATPTINTDNGDVFTITGLAQDVTSFTTNLSGTPTAEQQMIINITDNGTARAIIWGTSFEENTIALPLTTEISTLLKIGFIWNTVTSKWRVVAVA